MYFEKSIIETIKKRKSIRTYDNKPITKDDYEKINQYLSIEENLLGPLGRRMKFEVVQVSKNMSDKGIKLGTYGFIKNPKAYIVGMVENSNETLVEFGYVFEKLILFLTELNIGTCWLGGSFNRNSFEKQIDLKDDEIIPCITPIGYTKDKKRLFDKTLRMMIKADNKKSWDDLFYNASFEKKLMEEDADKFKTPIEMVRLGPSASNKQPWRIVLSDNKDVCHFYLERTPNYGGNKIGFDMQRIDIGIAMCHFELACKELAIKCNWRIEDPRIPPLSENTEYIISCESK
ncbi:nitroreductase family protein [Wukongibacter baidiensis]|uniref:nitroreductase family protein n=1 Tax=Wukongibacter baidiensis TaxID=1723361 RepID=UPI003D7FBFAF